MNRLAAVLRPADSLDREHQQKVRRVIMEENGNDGIVLHLQGAGDMLVERWAFERKTGRFEEVFGCALTFQPEKVSHEKS